MNKAVFLDKDGTIVDDLPYNVNPLLLTWKKDSFKALRLLADKGYLIIIITNQSGIARGKFRETELLALKEVIRNTLHLNGIPLAGFYYCPHYKGGSIQEFSIDCDCRKPKPGMLIEAAKEFRIDLDASWMIGDMLKDIEAGNTAGCRSILIEGNYQEEPVTGENNRPLFIAPTLYEAAEFIIRS